MSDTPDTDDAQFGTGRVGVDFARRLERERNAAQEINARLREIISRASRDYDEQIELFRAERNKLRDIAERALVVASMVSELYQQGYRPESLDQLCAELDQLKEGAK